MIVAAVPVKDLVNAKQRLERVLSPAERAALARTMLGDVLAALVPARLDRVWVVTRDAEAARLARAAGADVLVEDANRGHTAAVALAQARAAALGARVFLTVPGDVPGVTTPEIETLADAASAGPGAAAFVPSRSGQGTNGVALSPAGAMALRFGEPSFAGHLAAAERLRLTVRVLDLPGLSLDVDAPDDLAGVLREGERTATGRLLAGLRIGERVVPARAAAGR